LVCCGGELGSLGLYIPLHITRKKYLFKELKLYIINIINIYRYKGGTGKTTVATSLAITLSKSWGRTLYVEIGPVLVGVISGDVMAVVVDYPPCIRPGEGGLLVPVADWLSASALKKMKAKVTVLNKDRGFEFKLAAASEVIKPPFSYAVVATVAYLFSRVPHAIGVE